MTKRINKPDFEITEHMFTLGYLFIEDHNGEYHVEFHNCAIVPIINKIRIGELGGEENTLVFAFYKEDKDNYISDDNLISIIRFNLEKNKDILNDIKEWANTHKNVEYLGRAVE